MLHIRPLPLPVEASGFRLPRRLAAMVVALLLPALGCTTSQSLQLADDLLLQAVSPYAELETEAVKVMEPSNYRDWSPDQAVLPDAELDGDRVTVHNIRHCKYLTGESYVVAFYDKTFNLNRLESLDFIMVPFPMVPGLAHTMLSFGFAGGEYLVVSVEIRKEKDENYNPVNGVLRQYELMYVLGDERDLISLRATYRKDEVYLYRTRATREQARALFVDVMERVNQLAAKPEFYDTLTNNCSTNIMDHVNRLAPNRIPYDYRVLLPGHSDRLAYDLELLDTDASFEETKRRARITELARRYANSPDFSAKIRQDPQVLTAREGEGSGSEPGLR